MAETYEYNPVNSDVLAMLYGSGAVDMGTFARNKAFSHEPGGFMYYSSGTSNILCDVLKKAISSRG